MIEMRAVESGDDLDAYVRIWNAITPDEPVEAGDQRERRERDPQRLYEVDRQIEQIREVGDETPAQPPPGGRFVTIAERPELLRAAYELALDG